MKKNYLAIAFTIFALSSCKFYDPEEITPSYIYIEDIVLNTKSNEGSNSDNLIDAWVYVDGSLIGVYELPSKIPIHAQGNYSLQIFGGIKNNGSSSVRKRHDFLNSYKTTLNSIPLNIDTLIPVVEYEAGITIWQEDFEDPGIKFSSLSYSDTNMVITLDPDEVFEGNGSGKIHFETSHLLFEAKTNETIFNSFPKTGIPVYLEFDYKSNEYLIGGIYSNNSTSTLTKEDLSLGLIPTNVWKHAYIELTEEVSSQLQATEYEVYLEVDKNASSQPLVFIDNIKVIF